MTKMQVKKAMAANNITGELTGAGANWEVTLDNEKTMRRFQKLVCKVGGFGTGWGGWVLRPNYKDRGDWNDRTSAHHY